MTTATVSAKRVNKSAKSTAKTPAKKTAKKRAAQGKDSSPKKPAKKAALVKAKKTVKKKPAKKARKLAERASPVAYARAAPSVNPRLVLDELQRESRALNIRIKNLPTNVAAVPSVPGVENLVIIKADQNERQGLRGAQMQLSQLGTRLSQVDTPEHQSDLRKIAINVEPDLDPRLQLALVNRRMGKQFLRLSSTTGDELPVIARVADPKAWEALPDVFHGAVIGRAGQDSHIVTGRIPVSRIEAVRGHATVLSLKASQPLNAALDKTTHTMGVGLGMLKPAIKQNGGKGVVIGIVDFGGDFAHPNFRTQGGRTRLLALWNQADVPRAGDSVPYGRCYTQAEINKALTTSDPYQALNYTPIRESHGTHVMDIAAGNGLGTQIAGVAPQADLIFVEASASDVPWNEPDAALTQFGDSAQILEAVRFVFDQAGDKPCVVNLSLGTNGGPHDGSSLVEQGIDAIVRERPNSAVVIAASNSQLDDIHTDGRIQADASHSIEWEVIEHAGGEFELWYKGPCELEATVISPSGTELLTLAPGTNGGFQSAGQVAMFASSRLKDPNNEDHVICVWIAPGLEGGVWKIRLRPTNGHTANYHAWLERIDGAQPRFVNPTPTHTLGSISSGFESIVVGSYDAHDPAFPLSNFSSRGPTRDDREKPEVSAPGHQVRAACSTVPNGVIRKSGTSMAAPAITGLVALILSEAQRRNVKLSSTDLRRQLQVNTDNAPPAAGAWHPHYGVGRGSGKAV